MTVLEQRFMEQMPRLMRELLDQMGQLNKEIAELKEQLKTANELSAAGGE